MAKSQKHIVIDARIRESSTGRPVDRLLEYLQDIDAPYKYTIILARGDGWQPKSRKFKVVHSRFGIFSFNPLQQILYAWQLYRLKPDLVHFTMTGQQPIFYFGAQITFTHDLTMLKFVRAGRLPKWLHRLRMYGYRFLLWQSHHKAKKIIVPTEYVEHDVRKYHLFTQRKTVVTLEASEPPLSGESHRPDYAPDKFILYVGTAFPHKNLRRLVKSFEIIHEQQPELKLILAGKHEYHYRKLIKWTEKKPYSDSIIFPGFVPDGDLKWLYENAAAYVFPSRSEGFGLPGLEAMVHGCPVVSSSTTCLPEVYGDGAHYFDPMDIQDIAKKVLAVVRGEKLRENLIEKGHKQAKKFSWKRMTDQTVDVYTSILD